jgi:calcineurin-like phosphoesterase family protein
MEYCGRQFKNKDVMNNHIIKQYNKIVGKEDTCYILGDIAMSATKQELIPLIQKLNGIKILIAGNHDRFSVLEYYELGFSSVHGHLKLKYKEQEIYIAHDPAWAQIPNTLWFCGHIHNVFRKIRTLSNTLIINVGVDVWEFQPQSIDDLLLFSTIEDEEKYMEAKYPFRKKNKKLGISYFEERDV